jgi:hypothetical protein
MMDKRNTSHVNMKKHLLGSQDINDCDTALIPAREGNTRCLIYAENVNNITIEGLGEILPGGCGRLY